jgi:hypothetical protein
VASLHARVRTKAPVRVLRAAAAAPRRMAAPRIEQGAHCVASAAGLLGPLAVVHMPSVEQLDDLTAVRIVRFGLFDTFDGIATAEREEWITAPSGPLFEAAERATGFESRGVLPNQLRRAAQAFAHGPKASAALMPYPAPVVPWGFHGALLLLRDEEIRNKHTEFIGAPGRTRTSTMLPPPDFESGASTNSATGASH